MNSPLGIFAISGLIIIILVISYLLPRRKKTNELNKVAIYEEQCPGIQKLGFGIRYGSLTSNWRISLYEDMVVIGSIAIFDIKYADIDSVEYKEDLLSSLLHIKINSPKIDLILKPRNPQNILDVFLGKGVHISKQSPQMANLTKALRLSFIVLLIVGIGLIAFLQLKIRA